jgi:hypothetical protein
MSGHAAEVATRVATQVGATRDRRRIRPPLSNCLAVDDLRARISRAGLPELQWVEMGTGPRGPLFAFWTPGKDAIEWWHALRPHAETIGHPLLVGSDEDTSRIRESMDRDAREVGLVEAFDPAAWFTRRRTAAFDGIGPEERAEFENSIHGPWPAISPSNSFVAPFDALTHEPVERIWIALIPIAQSWEAAAAIEFGAWNECPSPEEHVVVMRYWFERWGAEPVAITSDTVEMLVDKPPHSQVEALALANEHFAYCEDIVTQGVGTIEALAATLLDGQTWFFWWD